MKHTKLALVIVLLCGMFSACKQEAPAPAAEVAPPDTMEPATTTPDATPADTMPADDMTPPAEDATPADDAGDEDTPHSGGDRVGTATGTGG